MRIGIDIMGGDFAPEAAVLGSFLARQNIPEDTELVLFGDKESIIRIAGDNGFDVSRVSVVHTKEVIHMSDHPYKSFTNKRDSSIVRAFRYLKADEIDALCSAGNTGAMMIGATQVINAIPGIIRPAIAANLPNLSGQSTILLDVGINPDSKPDVLAQYGILGKAYALSVNKVEDPRVGLINIGEEEEKGNLVAKSAYQLMKESKDYNFIGNVEADEFFTDPRADALVCDGFIGNIILKEAEGFYKLLKNRKITDDFFEFFNFENFGGTPVLGVNKPVVVGHGVSNEMAIKNMILHTWDVLRNDLISTIKVAIE
jgi:glycerol-3-phosphate acyltransferase PlsX